MKPFFISKRGLTITELIVAIFLLGLIIAIVIPIISNTISNQKNNLYNIQIENIKKGATAWAGQNVYLMPTDNGDSISISLGELKSKGFVEKNLTNPKTEDQFPDNILITIAKKNDTYLYTVDDGIESGVIYDPEAPYIVLNGGSTEYVELNGTYIEKGVQARNKDGNKISSINIVIRKEGTTVSNILTNNLNTYIITYTAIDSTNGKSSNVSRNVVIHDTKAPIISVNGRTTNHTMIVKTDGNFTIPNALVSDNSGEIITATLLGTVDTSKSGSYELIYEARDKSDNVGRLMLTVIVKNLGDEIFINYKTNTSLWTNQDVTITIMPVLVNRLASQAYSFDGGNTWQASPSKAFPTNQTVRMMARDDEGRLSEIVAYTISNIDKVLPTCSYSGNPSSWVINANIGITANDNASGVLGIMIPGSSTYTSGASASFSVSNNGTYTAKVKDIAGNVNNTCSVNVTKIDTESPTCRFEGNPTTWVKSAVLTIIGNDSQSGVVGIQKPGDSTYTSTTSTTPFNVTSNGTYTAYVKDTVGRYGTCTVEVTKIDATAPTQPSVTLKLDSTTGSNYTTGSWTNHSVIQMPVSNDFQSGIQKYQYSYDNNNWTDMSNPRTVTAEENRNYYVRAIDNVGNISSSSVVHTIRVDKTLPACSVNGNPTTWVTNATLGITATDNLSGVSGIMIPGSSTYTNGSTANFSVTTRGTYTSTVKDNAGNTNTCSVNVTRVDSASPTCSFSGNPTSWVKSATLTITGSDSESGVIGIQKPGDSTYTSTTSTTPFNVMSNGTYTAYVKDNVGRIGTCSVNVTRIDTEVPTCATSGGNNSWTNGNRTITGTCSDTGGSGCTTATKIYTYTQTINTTEAGPDASNEYYFYDNAGNRSASSCPRNQTVKIDKTNPTGSITVNGGNTYTKTITVNASLTASDTYSGVYQMCVQTSSAVGSCSWETYRNTKEVTLSTTDGTKTVYAWLKDNAGNVSATYSDSIILDATSPTYTITGASTTWTSANRTITVNCSDTGGSGCINSSYSSTFSTTTQTSSIEISDAAGNTIDVPVNVYVDKSTPSCSSITGASTTWTKNSRTISVACSDSGSGCSSSSFSQTYNNTTITSNITISDKVGNTRSCPVNVYVDIGLPECGPITGASTTWTNANRTISVSCNDEISGCTSSSFSNTFSATTQTSYITIADAAGNTRSCPVNVYIDKTAPTCTSSGGSTSWTNSNRTLTGTCSDTGGSGCVKNASKTYSSNINSATEGPGTVSDNAGNTTTCPANQTVRIDKTAPTCGTVTGGSSSWTNGNRTITAPCNDTGGSGCELAARTSTYAQSMNITNAGPDGPHALFYFYDNAGNKAIEPCANDQIVRIDKIAPTCTAGGGSSSWTTGNVTVTGACGDTGGSGCTTANISQTFTNEGNYLGTAGSVTDIAGNSTTCPTKSVLIDRTAPICGTVTGASTSWTGSNRTISVGCSDTGSGCSSSSFSNTFSSTTTTSSVVIRDNLANERYCSVNVYVDKTAPSCTAGGGTTTWTTGNVTVTGTCSDSHSGCTTANISQTFTNEGNYLGTAGSVTDHVGNSTVCPTKSVLIDRTAPTCGSITGASTSWTGSNRTISVGCSDTGSGCSSSSFSNTFSSTTTTSSVVIRDNLANERYCSVNVYVDKTAPSCSFTGSSNWDTSVTLTVSGGDNHSGIYQVSPGTGYITGSSASRSVSSAGTYTAYTKDYAGNTNSCTRSVSSRTEYRAQSCSTCNRCSSAGVDYYNYGGWGSAGKLCMSSSSPYPTKSEAESKGLTTYYGSCTYQAGTGNGCRVGQYYCSKYTRSSTPVYNRSCDKCGCGTWGSWGDWSTAYRSAASNLNVDIRTTYSAG